MQFSRTRFSNPTARGRRSAIYAVMAVGAVGSLSGNALAFEIDTGNSDVELRWDNSFRYNLGVRAQEPSKRVLNNDTFDDSDSKFDRGDVVTNRLDLLSEFEFKYRGRHGVRVTGAAWYDQAYDDHDVKANPAFDTPFGNTSLNTPGGSYNGYTKRYNNGLSGEFLDAFVYTGFDLGTVPVDLKIGRHNIFWGESMFTFAHGISYSQGPLDLRKAYSSPGVETKELFLPLNQLSVQAQLTDELSLAAQYVHEWKPTRFPDGGTYFGLLDFFSIGGGGYVINPATAAAINAGLAGTPFTASPVPFEGVIDKPDHSHDWGVRLNWRPEWLDGTMGIYYRKFTDKSITLVNTGVQASNPLGLPRSVGVRYLDDIKIYGVSLGKQVGGVSLGAELSYRENGSLLSNGSAMVGEEARGDTLHGVVNVLGLLPGNAIFDSASYIVELTYSRLQKVRRHRENFNGVGYAACTTNDKWDGCATRDNWGLAVMFEPKWYQVTNGVDVTMPMFLNYGLKGNSPVVLGGYQGFGNYSIGVATEIHKRYNISLAYNGYLVKQTKGINQVGLPAITSVNGIGNHSDRGWVSLTLKTTF